MSFLRPEDVANPSLLTPLLDRLYGFNGLAVNTVVPAGSGTIATWDSTANLPVPTARLNPAADVASMVLQAGTFEGQQIELVNISTHSVTFATAATSNVADGTGDAILTLTAAVYKWDSTAARWFRRV